MQEQISQIIGDINGFLWNYIIIILLIIAVVLFKSMTKFLQVR